MTAAGGGVTVTGSDAGGGGGGGGGGWTGSCPVSQLSDCCDVSDGPGEADTAPPPPLMTLQGEREVTRPGRRGWAAHSGSNPLSRHPNNLRLAGLQFKKTTADYDKWCASTGWGNNGKRYSRLQLWQDIFHIPVFLRNRKLR